MPYLAATNNDNRDFRYQRLNSCICQQHLFISTTLSWKNSQRKYGNPLIDKPIYRTDQSRGHVTDATTTRTRQLQWNSSPSQLQSKRHGPEVFKCCHEFSPSISSLILLLLNILGKLPWRPISSTTKPAQQQQAPRRRKDLERRTIIRDCNPGLRNSTYYERSRET